MAQSNVRTRETETKHRSLNVALMLVVFLAACAMFSGFILMRAFDDDADPALECVSQGGVYTDHGQGFGPAWSCEYPPGVAPLP